MAVRINQNKLSIIRNIDDPEVRINQNKLSAVRQISPEVRINRNLIEVVRKTNATSSAKVTTAIITF